MKHYKNLILISGILALSACASTKEVLPNPEIYPNINAPKPTTPTIVSQPKAPIPTPTANQELKFEITDFNDLPNWQNTNLSAARNAFIRNCTLWAKRDAQKYLSEKILYSGKIADWQSACKMAKDSQIDDNSFWQNNFTPWKLSIKEGNIGRLTSYFEPIFEASLSPNETFSEPLYGKPNDLIQLDLGAFDPSLTGRNIVGRIDGAKFIPYRKRSEINASNAPIIAWAKMGEALSLQIQGSGRLIMNDNKQYRAAFSAHNGQPFGSVAKEMIKRNILPQNQASADNITKWFETADKQSAREIINSNPRTVFFELQPINNANDGPKGGAGIPLEASGSLAVDTLYHAYGTPIFIEADSPRLSNSEHSAFSRLLIAQDTGGAIKGPIRGDLYWGTGAEAGIQAGRINHDASWWVLLPKGLNPTRQ